MRSRSCALLAALVVAQVATGADVAAAQVTQQPITIVTVPSASHVRFQFAGRVYTTDGRGVTRIPAALGRNLLLRRLPVAPRIKLLPNRLPDGSHYRLERWYPNRLRRPRITAAIDLYRPVRFALQARGRPVSVQVLDAFQMKRSDGQVLNLRGAQLKRPVMLQASRVMPLNGKLVSKDLLYRIQRASIGGNNLVNRAQQSFLPSKTMHVKLRLLFYSVTFEAKDTLFGSPIGSGIRLVYPNGQVQVQDFDRHGKVSLEALPRGTYHVSVVGPGLSASTPVSITRDHTAELKVLSYLDIAVLAVLFLALALGLMLARRPALRRRLSPRWHLRQRRAARRSA